MRIEEVTVAKGMWQGDPDGGRKAEITLKATLSEAESEDSEQVEACYATLAAKILV